MGLRGGVVAAASCGLLALTSAPAHAQGTPSGAQAPAKSAPAKSESSDAVDRARVHYERGIQLFNEDNYDAALFEFDRAYELAPSYKILYNMGRIQRQQNNYAAALRSYARYLREGGANIPTDRRTEVENEITVLKPRVAALRVTVNVDGADVYADDTPVCAATIESSCAGKSPLQAPIIVNGGRHKITAVKAGYATATSIVSVVGSDVVDVKLELVSFAQATPHRRVPWGGWIATGVLAAGAGVFGALSLSESSSLEEARGQPNANADDLDSRSTRTTAFGIAADGLAVSAIVVGAISLYYTIKWGKETESNAPAASAPARSFAVKPTLGGAAFTF